jgi:hypothetical protein
VTVIAAAAALMAVLAPSALATTPAPGYEQFAGCPSPAENPTIEVCAHTLIKGGYFQMGNKNVPLKKQMTLSGGVNGELNGFVANSKGGLTPVKQLVPGGVIGLTGLDWLVNFLSIEALQLYAVTELVGTPNVVNLSLPIRVHLINPALGNNCYVGSSSNPIQLKLTSGTTNPPPPNTPISGVRPEVKFDEATSILTISNGTAVDNSFAAPGASGCVLTLFGFIPVSINGLVNAASGLPAPAGTNATSQELDIQLAPSPVVYP